MSTEDDINEEAQVEVPTPVPVTALNDSQLETMVVVEAPGLDQDSASKVRPDATIRYTNKDSGRDLPPFSSRNKSVHREEGLHMTPGDTFVVGETITIDVARRLVARGYCEIV